MTDSWYANHYFRYSVHMRGMRGGYEHGIVETVRLNGDDDESIGEARRIAVAKAHSNHYSDVRVTNVYKKRYLPHPLKSNPSESVVLPVLGVVALGLFAGWIVNKMWGTKQAPETLVPETTIPQISGFEHDVFAILPSSTLTAVALPNKGERSEVYFTRVGADWKHPADDTGNVRRVSRVHSRDEWDGATAKALALRNKPGQGPLIIIYEDATVVSGGTAGIVSWLVPPKVAS